MNKSIEKKIELQEKAIKSWIKNGYKGTVVASTGSGKTKIGVDAASLIYDKMEVLYEIPRILIISPTKTIRDQRWYDEFKKFDKEKIYNISSSECYASMHKIKDREFDLVILDEAHHITELNSIFFSQNKIRSVLALTGTPPKKELKQELIKIHCPVILTYTLDQSTKDSVTADYEITVIQYELDDTQKNIEAGGKNKKFMTTAKKMYSYMSSQIDYLKSQGRTPSKFLYLNRMRFLYNLPQKNEIAKFIINNVIKNERSLIFCGSIKQSKELCKYNYSSKTDDKHLKLFKNKSINHLSCVDALDEGEDLPDMDSALILKLVSDPRKISQQIGRTIRYRENHKSKIYIPVAVNTQEEVWLQSSIQDFDEKKIRYVNYEEFKSENEGIIV